MKKHVPLLALAAACAVSCGNKPAPTPTKDAPPTPAPTMLASAPAPSATAAVAVKAIPTLVPERFAPKGTKLDGLYAIEGALMVNEGRRVGRIVGDDVEWVGKISDGMEALGGSLLSSVVGRWPDEVGATYMSVLGRAPYPTWEPITGKAASYTAGEVGMIRSVARVGSSTLLLADGPMRDTEIVTVRGPKLVRKMTTDQQAGCKPNEVWKSMPDAVAAGVPPRVMESTPAGTLVTIGILCDKRGPAAEVWDKDGKARIIDLSAWWKKASYSPALVKGSGDELFAYSDGFTPVLRYHDGAFEALPPLAQPVQKLFASATGQLHAYDGRTIFRFEEGQWTAVARFAERTGVGALAMDEKGTFWMSAAGIHRLREAPAPAAPADEPCQTWFVYLYQVSDKSEPQYTFPTTRKALSSFPQVSDLGLVDFKEDYRRHLGITVTSKAQGEAVVAHVKATMPDEDPKLFCYAPRAPRKIDMNAKK